MQTFLFRLSQGRLISVPCLSSSPCLTSKQFLLERPRGAYTTARTLQYAQRVIEFQMHVDRLSTSWFNLTQQDLSQTILTQVESAMSQALNVFKQENPLQEARLTVLLYEEENEVRLDVFVEKLPSIPVQVEVAVQGEPRSLATTKDSEWLRQRAQLETLLVPPLNEILLSKNDLIYEGLSSNVVIVYESSTGNYRLQTAPKSLVLPGTILHVLCERVAPHLNIPVEWQCPSLHEMQHWKALFVCSTSRLALPVKKLHWKQVEKSFDLNIPIVSQLTTSVQDTLMEASTLLK